MKITCKSITISEPADEICQVIFSAESEIDNGPYLLLQRAFLEEDEDGPDDPCYLETHNERLIGHYPVLDAELKFNQLILNLPPPMNEIIEVSFEIEEDQFLKLKDMLAIILQ